MSGDQIAAVASVIIAVVALYNSIGQRGRTMAEIATKLVDPMSKRIDDLEGELAIERKARRALKKMVLRLLEGIKILTRQLCENGIQPAFVLTEEDDIDDDL